MRSVDALSAYSGVRPVVASGKRDPSAESRESALWSSPGIVHVVGGKLTTFASTARQVLRRAAQDAPRLRAPAEPLATPQGERNGVAFSNWFQRRPPDDHTVIAATRYHWGELRWSLREEQVMHLDDLMLRRTRLGLLLPFGGGELFDRLGPLCRAELGWDDARWASEITRYRELWRRFHAPPE